MKPRVVIWSETVTGEEAKLTPETEEMSADADEYPVE